MSRSKPESDTTATVARHGDPLRHVKPEVRELSAYTLTPFESEVKLNQNESPWDAPLDLKRRVMEAVLERNWARYPEFSPQRLQQRLAEHAAWRKDGVLVGNGSNELIEAMLRVTVAPGTPVLIPEPTFSLYPLLTRILGGQPVRAGLNAHFEYDVAELQRVRREQEVPVTIVCSPNNPTGSVMAIDDVATLCADGDGLVVVDEAYHEFSGGSVVALLESCENLVVLRTFSKALGLAGLRVGYLLASPALVAEVDKARLPYNLGIVAEAAALAALDERDMLARRVGQLIEERERLRQQLDRTPGVRTWPSGANFILFALEEEDPLAVFAGLLRRGVLVRDVSSAPLLSRCLRVSVGSYEENAEFLRALRRTLEEVRSRRT